MGLYPNILEGHISRPELIELYVQPLLYTVWFEKGVPKVSKQRQIYLERFTEITTYIIFTRSYRPEIANIFSAWFQINTTN